MHNGHESIKYEIVDPPAGRLCKNNHIASINFKNIENKIMENRFIKISGPHIPKDLRGVYCEYCLSVANALAKFKKMGHSLTE